MFVFIVVVWTFFFNKYMIQNPVFFVYHVIMLSIVYAIVLWANFYVKLLMFSTKAAVNSFDECNVFEKAAILSVIVFDIKLYNSNDEAFSINTVCNCRSRYDNFVYFNRPRTLGIRVCDRKPSRIPKKRSTRILKKSRKVRVYFEPTSEKAYRSLPECIFLQIKLVKKYMHMESAVRIKEERNIPLLQSRGNIESLTNTVYWKCKTNIHMQ